MDPALYDALHQPYDEDLPFWRRLAQGSSGPILEIGCGTGRVLLPLLREGFDIWGVDYDPLMLAYLRRKAPGDLRPRLRLVCADIRSLALAQKFGLLFVPCNTWSTFDGASRRAALHRAVQHLLPGGRLAFSVPNPAWIAQLPSEGESEPEALLWHPDLGQPVQVSSAWRREGQRWVVWWHYDLLWPDGMVERTSVRQVHYLVPPERQKAEFREVGLKVEAFYGAFEPAPWHEESPYLIWVLQKPEG